MDVCDCLVEHRFKKGKDGSRGPPHPHPLLGFHSSGEVSWGLDYSREVIKSG